MMNIQKIILHLTLSKGVGPEIIKKIVSQQSVPLVELYRMSAQELCRTYHLYPHQAEAVVQGLATDALLEKELESIDRYHINIVTLVDGAYPALLKEIHCPPALIYYKGNFLHATQKKQIAIVGSRKANHYAQQVINAWVPTLIEKQWSIVSGGALGADTMAHTATLQAQGHTIAVLGSGLLRPYPQANVRMFERIVDQGGAVISTFPLQETAHAGNFPARNRIISGLSSACLIVQAAKKSGASITAEYALEQGRTVCAVPGSIFDPLHEGCHALIKEGATIISSLEDLMQELGEAPLFSNASTQDVSQIENQIAIPLIDNVASPIEQRIMKHCMQGYASTDELLAHLDISLDELHDHLFNLQLHGTLEQNAAGLWQAK